MLPTLLQKKKFLKDSVELCNIPKDGQIIESKAGIKIPTSLAPKIVLLDGPRLVLGQLEATGIMIIRLHLVLGFTPSSQSYNSPNGGECLWIPSLMIN